MPQHGWTSKSVRWPATTMPKQVLNASGTSPLTQALDQEPLRTWRAAIHSYLAQCFPVGHDEAPLAPLVAAIEYSLLAPGKRIRPLLTCAIADAHGLDIASVLPFACSVELIHCYSLVHDDLPAMDDDDLRRGVATNHRAFDEATAILVGDALQSAAYRGIADAHGIPAEIRIAASRELAGAAGWRGMVGGQFLDVSTQTASDLDVIDMHDRKTGALFSASVALGAIAAGVPETGLASYRAFGYELGRLFQLVDDLLDVSADEIVTGKTSGTDARRGKTTGISLHGGLDEAMREVSRITHNCIELVKEIPGSPETLQAIVGALAVRDR